MLQMVPARMLGARPASAPANRLGAPGGQELKGLPEHDPRGIRLTEANGVPHSPVASAMLFVGRRGRTGERRSGEV